MSAVVEALEAGLSEAEDRVAYYQSQRDKHRQKEKECQDAYEVALRDVAEIKQALDSYDA